MNAPDVREAIARIRADADHAYDEQCICRLCFYERVLNEAHEHVARMRPQ